VDFFSLLTPVKELVINHPAHVTPGHQVGCEAECRAPYEAFQHEPIFRAAGLSDQQRTRRAQALAGQPQPQSWTTALALDWLLDTQ
jgi:hypothetical protein